LSANSFECDCFFLLFQDTLDAVEILLKKHEAFEKSAATQEERFAALEKLTTVRVHYHYNLSSL